jgi:hypothetical protein
MKFVFKLISFLTLTLFLGFFTVHTALASSYTLSGSVKDSSGTAISGATVTVNDANSDTTTTDNSGNYSLTVPSGTYNVQVTPPAGSGFSSATDINQIISANTVVNFILTPAGSTSVSGHIYDAAGSPAPGQTVGLMKNSDGSEVDVTTDSSGSYSIPNVISGAKVVPFVNTVN